MNILIIGVSGFIGHHLYNSLKDQGHSLKGCSRHNVPGVNWHYFDFHQTEEDWLVLLDEIDIVINTAGIYVESKSARFKEVHTEGPKQLFDICNRKNIRVLQISAIGAEREKPVSEFLRSKRVADQFLLRNHLPQVVLYPGIVLGENGRSTQQLSLIARQFIRPMVFSRDQEVPLISIDQLTDQVVYIINNWPKKNLAKVLVAQAETIEDLFNNLRRWMNLKRFTGIEVHVPGSIVNFIFKLFPKFSVGVFNRHSLEMLDDYQLHRYRQGIVYVEDSPASESLLINMASDAFVKQRKLDFLFYLNLIVLGFIWIMSGVSSVVNMEQSREIVSFLEIDKQFGNILIISASVLDIFLGVFLWVSRYRALVIYLQIAVMLSYSIIISLFIPLYWLHPFAPVIKNFSMFMLGLYLLVDKKEK